MVSDWLEILFVILIAAALIFVGFAGFILMAIAALVLGTVGGIFHIAGRLIDGR